MRLEDAKAEVLTRIGIILGYKVTEGDLSPQARQSVTSIASAFRQLVNVKQLLLLEQKSHSTMASRVARAVTGSKEDEREVADYVAQIGQLQKDLSGRIETAAERISEEMEATWASPGSPAQPAAGHTVIEPLKCANCGADLDFPAGRRAKCAYCGAKYALGEYLDRLGASIRGTQPGPQQDAKP
jgi:hypothetical protein